MEYRIFATHCTIQSFQNDAAVWCDSIVIDRIAKTLRFDASSAFCHVYLKKKYEPTEIYNGMSWYNSRLSKRSHSRSHSFTSVAVFSTRKRCNFAQLFVRMADGWEKLKTPLLIYVMCVVRDCVCVPPQRLHVKPSFRISCGAFGCCCEYLHFSSRWQTQQQTTNNKHQVAVHSKSTSW